MTQIEYDQLRTTFPWSQHLTTIPGRGGLVQVLDNRGQEVPLFTMTKFLMFVTSRLAQATAAATPATPPTEAAVSP